MKHDRKILADEDIRRINQALSQAQWRTSARIVPVVARCSGRYERAEDMVGLWAAALGLALAWIIFAKTPTAELAPAPRSWTFGLIPILLVVVGGFLVGAMFATHLRRLCRMFVPRRQMERSVRESARNALNDCRVSCGDTAEESFLLIYVSVYERLAAVDVDEALQEKLDTAELESVRQSVQAAFTSAGGNLRQGILDGIALAAEVLGRRCPPVGNHSSLPDSSVQIVA